MYSKKLMNYTERHSRIVKHWFIIAVVLPLQGW